MKKTRKILAVVLGLMLAVSLMSLTVSADTFTSFKGYTAEPIGTGSYDSARDVITVNTYQDGAKIYLDGGNNVEGTIFMEYTIYADTAAWNPSSSNGCGINIQTYDASGTGKTRQQFYKGRTSYSDGLAFVCRGDDTLSPSEDIIKKTEVASSVKRLHVKIKYDSTTGKHMVWLNGQALFNEEKNVLKGATGGISYISIWAVSNETYSFDIENFKWYPERVIAAPASERIKGLDYSTDFSESTLNTNFVELGQPTMTGTSGDIPPCLDTTQQKIYAKEMSGRFVGIYAGKDAYTEPVTVEFDLGVTGLITSSMSNGQLQFFALSSASNNRAIDIRWMQNNSSTGFFRVYGTSGNKDYSFSGNNVHFKLKLFPAEKKIALWLNDNEVISEAEGASYVYDSSVFTDFFRMVINSNRRIWSISLDNLKVYSDSDLNTPAPWEVVSHEDFGTRVDLSSMSGENYAVGNMLLCNPGNITYTWADGGLTTSTTATNGPNTWIYKLQSDGSDMTGEYVIETKLSVPKGSNNHHRLWFCNAAPGQAESNSYNMYVAWNPNIGDNFYIDTRGSGDVNNSCAAYNAASTLKVTVYCNTATNLTKVWFNDIFAWEGNLSNGNSFDTIYFCGMQGGAKVEDIIVYRPITATTDAQMANDGNNIKIAASNNVSGKVFFAKYENDDDTLCMEDAGVSADIAAKRDYIYKIDKQVWSGGKAFFWDADLNPLTDAVNIN